MKEKAWEMEFARKSQPLKPCCIGCCWAVTGAQKDALLQYQAVLLTTLPITISFDQQEKAANDIKTTPKAVKSTGKLYMTLWPCLFKSSTQNTACFNCVNCLAC